MPPAATHSLVVLTSRLAVIDISRWKNGAAPVVDVEELSKEMGAALLRDNGVRGTEAELRAAVEEFGGHPLALSLLASVLKETQSGDVRRRDHIRELLDDPENPRHDHAKRVMESYEREWLTGEPVPHAVMRMVGLFDRPASGDCLRALRDKPAIPGLTDAIVNLDDREWGRIVTRLRDVRLLVPQDPDIPDAVDAHPLVREWFGQRLEEAKPDAWRAAHGRLYEHLRDTTGEGYEPTLKDLAPLYQAISHGCRAGRHQQALDDIYIQRICRQTDSRIEFYARTRLGAVGTDLAAISCFFEKPYEYPVATLTAEAQAWALGEAARSLGAQGRLAEAIPAHRAALRMGEEEEPLNSALRASNLSQTELLVGEVAAAVGTAERSVAYADKSGNESYMAIIRTTHADALYAAGRRDEAERLFADAEERQKKWQPQHPQLYSLQGYRFCDLLLAQGEWSATRDRVIKILELETKSDSLLERASARLALGRAHLGLALENAGSPPAVTARDEAQAARTRLGEAVEDLRAATRLDFVPRSLLALAAFHRGIGDWDGAVRELEPGDLAAGGYPSLGAFLGGGFTGAAAVFVPMIGRRRCRDARCRRGPGMRQCWRRGAAPRRVAITWGTSCRRWSFRDPRRRISRQRHRHRR
jgi:tetratricopeptide (TPR) repeat protein